MQIQANGISLEVDDQGPVDGEPILLIMGLGMQLIAWPEELVQELVARGFRVIRFDNRDIGLSQSMDALGTPNLPLAVVRHMLHLPVHAPYTLADLARDAVGVLDALGLASAHVCGASMGGMVAQHLAAEAGPRLRSLTLMMTTSGARQLPQAAMKVRQALIKRPGGSDIESLVAHSTALLGLIGSPAYPMEPERLRRRVDEMVRRSYRPAGVVRQLVAIAADGDRSALLARIQAPTLVIHGNDDPLVPVAAGHDLVRRIRSANSDFIDGMGHNLPLELLPRFADRIAANAKRAATMGG